MFAAKGKIETFKKKLEIGGDINEWDILYYAMKCISIWKTCT